ncbi:hypothetical protein KP509_12G076900 [Ceratopteris richardii]|uniref:1-phosphatidylinositol-3-phosphate 5-kinase n=1 Tax=Ceratopteris richardii TaxID=49495 RepID=A0A8T2TQX5_CERRI|nr:hypothetical protein KP509_12G076900 [Ceratopteris richardii]
MRSRFDDPKVLLLGCSLEFEMEMEYTTMAVSKIEALNPNVVLVEKSVSHQAREQLLGKGICLVSNIKRSSLERIASCTGATIAMSIDHLSSAKLGHCVLFHVEKYEETHDIGVHGSKSHSKALMFLEDCPKPFGCSILLKGSSSAELEKVKHALKMAVFAAYHLALETSFLVDEGAKLPELCLKSQLSVAVPYKKSKSELSISAFSDINSSPVGQLASPSNASSFVSPSSKVGSPLNSCMDSQFRDCINTVTSVRGSRPEVAVTTFADFSTLMSMEDSGQNINGCMISVREPMSPDGASEFSPASQLSELSPGSRQAVDYVVQLDSDSFSLISEENNTISPSDAGKGAHTSRYSSQSSLQVSCSSDVVQGSIREKFSAFSPDHQSILVSYSSSCLRKGTVCERGHLFRIKYYSTFDKPLGIFLQETLFNQLHKCQGCGELKDAHVDCYTHRQGRLTISVHKQNQSLAGETEGKIWMWQRCLKCARVDGIPPATPRVVMSDAAWGLSFGKFLELSFSNHASTSRASTCGHSLHRDCLRFYGFGNMVACIRYSPIHVYTVYLPPSKLDFYCFEHQKWLQQEIREIAERGHDLFKDLRRRFQHLYDKCSVSERDREAEVYVAELRSILTKQKNDFHRALTGAKSCRSADQPHIDILRLNSIRRSLKNCLNLWDKRMQTLSSALSSSKGLTASDSRLAGDSLSLLKQFRFDSGRSRYTYSKESSVTGRKLDVQATKRFPSVRRRSVDGFKSVNGTDAKARGSDFHASEKVGPSLSSKSPELYLSNDTACERLGETPYSIQNFSEGSSTQAESSANFSGGRSGVYRSLSDGHCLDFKDLPATFDAAWTGSQEVGESKFDWPIERNEEIQDLEPSSADGSKQSRSDMSEEVSVDSCVQNVNLSSDFCVTSTLTTAARTGESSVIEGWVGAPYSNFRVHYNKDENVSSTPSPCEAEAQSPAMPISTMQQEGSEEGIAEPLFEGLDEPVISLYDDEPTSVIAYAITSHEHQAYVFDKEEKQNEREKDLKTREPEKLISVLSGGISQLLDGILDYNSKQENSSSSDQSSAGDPLLDSRANHVKINFTDDSTEGKTKYSVTCYYAKQFDGLRKRCCDNNLDFVRSLCRCKKWRAQGGKSNVFFAKTSDDRFVVKQITKTELDSFMIFAPEYFKYVYEALGTRSPTCLAKILGIYQVTVKHVKGGKEFHRDLMVMENLLYGRHITRIYDLKGSLRSRYNADATGNDAVLLDQNLLEALQTNPIFISSKAKRLLERAVWNDTAFLASVDVMDYSLLVGVDEDRQQLVLGIIDFMRQYTWDKHLETWVKASGILGGPKNAAPTVISPKQYKKRFRKAMSTYFLMVPDQWSQDTPQG